MNIKARASIIEPRILGHGRGVGNSACIRFGGVVRIKRKEAETGITGSARNNDLVLPVNSSRLVLQIIFRRRRQFGSGIDTLVRSRKLRRSDVVSEILVYSAAVKISHIPSDSLGQLPIDAHSGLTID